MIATYLDLMELDLWLVREPEGSWLAFTTAYPFIRVRKRSLEGLVAACSLELGCIALTDGHDIRVDLVPVMLEAGLKPERFGARYAFRGSHVGRLVVSDIRDGSELSLLPSI